MGLFILIVGTILSFALLKNLITRTCRSMQRLERKFPFFGRKLDSSGSRPNRPCQHAAQEHHIDLRQGSRFLAIAMAEGPGRQI